MADNDRNLEDVLAVPDQLDDLLWRHHCLFPDAEPGECQLLQPMVSIKDDVIEGESLLAEARWPEPFPGYDLLGRRP